LLLGCQPGKLLGFCQERVVDLDINAHGSSVAAYVGQFYNTYWLAAPAGVARLSV
jgi:hypothetical protein